MKQLLVASLSILTFNSMTPYINGYGNDQLREDPAVQNDGPYVRYNSDQVLIDYIVESNGGKLVSKDSIGMQNLDTISLRVMTDVPGELFRVKLKKKLKSEKSEFGKANKLLALSDIEGNFGALRKLLVANKVLDQEFNWIFGNGELVLIGDFFDRGQQVTEVLWLIYDLEEKAQAAGGYVHFILGNHEIMNLSGDLRYVQTKYLENASLLNKNYVALYDLDTELGRWLRTKNIVEKIGDIVFTHGGISGAINDMGISIPLINKLARPYYDDTTYQYSDQRSAVIFSDLGPFWYRGYYLKSDENITLQIDNTLSQFKVKHIITGHTIVSDTISVWHNGKLLNTDVHHSEGKSEALLIENGGYYRVDAEGNRVLLMQASKK